MDYLDDVPEDKAFVLGEKKILNLYGLLFELRAMNDDTYGHYAASDHNYFSDWIEHVILDKELADSLRKTNSRKEAIDALEISVEKIRKEKAPQEAINEIEFHVKIVPEAKEEASDEKEEIATEKKEPAMPASVPQMVRPELKPFVKKEEDYPKEEKEAKLFLWKHFGWEMAKEFMYGLAFGILIGLILSKMFLR